MATLDKDIDLVLVTGAGASRDLGAGGKQIPDMKEWSNRLVDLLAAAGSFNYVQTTGLQKDLDGIEFEERLGRFLTARLAFTQVAGIVHESAKFTYPQMPILSSEGVLDDWHRQVDFHLTQIENAIQASLYDLFAEPEFDLRRAAEAYREILGNLGIVDRRKQWVYATTNYDSIGEAAIESLGYGIDWGQRPQVRAGASSPIDVEGLVDGLRRSVAVLHLHGRVGWYRRKENGGPGDAYAAPVTAHQPDLGTPIVMLPNPEKPYESDDIIMSIWRQFEDALSRAKLVFILGHSLHDARLVEALKQRVEPRVRLAVSVFGHTQDPSRPFSNEDWTKAMVEEQLPGAKIIPIRFGDEKSARGNDIADWLEHVRARGL